MFELPGRFRLGILSVLGRSIEAANHVYFGGWDRNGHGEVVVTDGVIVGVIPVQKQQGEDEAGPIPVGAWNRAMSGTSKDDVRRVTLQKNWVKVHDGKDVPIVAVPRGESDAQIPNYRGSIPEPKAQKVALSLNPDKLMKLARIIGSPELITLHMDPHPTVGVVDRAVRVSVNPWEDNNQPHGAIMPFVIEKNREGGTIRREEIVAKKGVKSEPAGVA